MHQLLQPESPVPVTQIKDGEAARPDHVYIVPPGATLELTDDHFKLSERGKDRGAFRPIDIFFNSLAQVKKRDAYCVVLSGTGTDGSEGLKTIKAAGGFALVQESTGARFPGMPDSAVATGLVDFILPVSRIAGRLQDIINHRREQMDDKTQEELRDAVKRHLPGIAKRLAEVSGNDFSEYKPGTLVRRIERRMALLRTQTVDQFMEKLQEDDAQAELLAQEFLIGVTRFFRDPEVWNAVRKQVVRPLLQRNQTHVRIWVPGCSTGEEAYTLAILFLEEMEAQKEHKTLQVFGTDIDVPALTSARYGVFSPSAVEALSETQLEKFFSIENGQYRASPALRECCVFAPHNLAQDPPFSRLDLISCRNLLIYLSSELQDRVIPRMHFALREEGHLVLGPSEGVGDDWELFTVVDRTNKIFAKNASASTKYSALNDPLPRLQALGRRTRITETQVAPAAHSEIARETLAEREYLKRFAAPYALITGSGEIAYLSERMTEFVQPNAGVPSSNIDTFLRRELRLPVRNALKQARDSGEMVSVQDVMIDDEGPAAFVDIQLGPTQRDESLFLLSLNRVRSIEAGSLGVAVQRRENADQDMLESENFNLRRQLSAILQESETSSQELKSTNEELLSMNEELQSSNEELETSREELQSINEELETVNSELQENNRLLTRANSDLKNLFESTDVAVLFLDRNFCVRNFTPATTRLFGIRRRDIGRPISDLSSKMDYPGLAEDAAEVDESLQGLEREVHVKASGETFLLRIKPYRTTENVIDGYVLSFVDITKRKKFEETLQRNQQELAEQFAELEKLYDTTPVGLCLQDRDLRYIRINEALAKINGFSVEDHLGKTIYEVFDEPDAQIIKYLNQVFETGKSINHLEVQVATPGAGLREYLVDYYPVDDGAEVFAVGACVRDVTDERRLTRKLSEQAEQQKLLLGELEHRVKNTLATISAISKLLLRDDDSAADYQKRLTQRLQAIARTHNLLTSVRWAGVSLNDMIEAELAPYSSKNNRRLIRHGPDLELGASEALSLGMTLHELATNAAKYGSLSVPNGKVVIETEMSQISDDESEILLTWSEIDGPKIETSPDRQGFGSVVFEKVLARDLKAEVRNHFGPEGLTFSARFHLRGEK